VISAVAYLLVKPPGSRRQAATDTAMPADVTSPVRSTTSTTVLPTHLIFSAMREGNEEVLRRDLDSGAETNLTRDPADDRDPAFRGTGPESPIVFASNRDGDFELYVMGSNGSRVRRLTFSPGDDVRPDWSPDGRQIVFVSARDGARTIYVMDADGTNVRRVTPPVAVPADLLFSATDNVPLADNGPAWASTFRLQGQTIVFTSWRGDAADLFVVQPDGTGLRQLTDTPGDDREPSWSPDGTKIVFTSTRDGNAEIYVTDADGSNQTRLTHDPALDYTAVWTSFGKVLFTSERSGAPHSYLMNPDGTDVVPTSRYDDQPSLTPRD
jgi:Tol biopolymer transport system component